MSDGSVLIEFKGDTKDVENKAKSIGDKVKNSFGKVGDIASKAFKGVSVAVGAATTAMTGLVTASVNAYAEYEQLVGGVDTLFKSSSQKVQAYADEAFKTAGMSANQYMDTVTSFSASLLQSLGGDTNKAADYANQAVIDMSDNANKMGTSIESIQNAYQGFAKQNYTMLDNLKLGYGGTKEEMERLLADASKISGIKYDISSFADVTQAIHVMQESMGIAGTTAKEASTTIEGSLNSVKGAWNNLLVGIAASDTDWEKLINDLVDTVTTAMENILPVVKTALVGVSALVRDLFPMIAQEIPNLIAEILPDLVQTGIDVVNSLVTGIGDNLDALIECAMQIITSLGNGIITMLPQILDIGMQIITQIINGISEQLPNLTDSVLDIITQLVVTFLNLLPQILNIGIQIILQLINGITQEIPLLIPQIISIITTLVQTLLDNLPLIISAGIQLLIALIQGLVEALPQLIAMLPTIINTILTVISENLPTIIEAGVQILIALINGLVEAIPQLIGYLPQIIMTIVTILINNLPLIIDAGIQILVALINGLVQAIPKLIAMLPQIIMTIVSTLIQNLPAILNIGIQLILSLINGIISMLGNLGQTAWEIIKSIGNTLAELPGKALQWGKDMIQGFIDGIKNMIGNIGKAIGNIGNTIKNFLHFSRPDKGPLRDYEKWMPDMIKGLTKTLHDSAPKLYTESKALAQKISDNLDLTEAYERMKSTVALETQKLSANLSTQAVLESARNTPRTITNDNGTTINNTQNFYEKNATPYEEQKQARQQLRRLAYGL